MVTLRAGKAASKVFFSKENDGVSITFSAYSVTSELTHLFPMHLFSTPWKHQKTVRFSNVFRGVEKVCTGNKCANITFAKTWRK